MSENALSRDETVSSRIKIGKFRDFKSQNSSMHKAAKENVDST